jgi:hypothetical protein
MDEPEFYNHSDFEASVLPILDRDGADARVVIVKASFAIQPDGRLAPLATPRGIRMSDETWGAPHIPDIRLPADFCAAKRGTDVALIGHAAAPDARAITHVDVDIRVADRVRQLRVWGPRIWQRAARGVVPGPSLPVQPTPLAWSRAFGGLDLSDPARPLEEPRNPVGSGVARDVARLVGTLAPQIETPGRPIGVAGLKHEPAGCAPIGRSFEPRRACMGTYDDAWLKSAYPARPADYREEHENFAAPGLRFDTPLRGGERVAVSGVRAPHALDFALPKWRVLIDAAIDREIVERRPHLDTVVIDSDALVLELVWRALFRCPPKMRQRFVAARVRAKAFTS